MAIDFSNLMSYSFMGNTVEDYIIAIAVLAGSTLLLKIFELVIIKRLEVLAKKTKNDLDDTIVEILAQIGWPFYFFSALYISSLFLFLNPFVMRMLYYVMIIVMTYYVVVSIQRLITYTTKKVIAKSENRKSKSDVQSVKLVGRIAKVVLWVIAIIVILSNLGYNVSGLVAGLGIGGIAVAFALQNVLSDIFASFSIHFDKPFELDDFIIIGNDMGVVKKIGIKSTRIQTLQGQELVVSNKELTSTRINNYKKMQRRRIAFNFGVTYQTSVKKLKKIPELVKKIFDSIDDVDLDRVHFKKLADFSLEYEVVYYLNSNDYNVYMDTQQEANLKLMEALQKEKVEFAYPTQTVFVTK